MANNDKFNKDIPPDIPNQVQRFMKKWIFEENCQINR